MQISELTLRLLLLFLPGMITVLMIEYLTVYKERKPFYFFIYSFILGFLAYYTFFAGLKVGKLIFFSNSNVDVRFLSALFDKSASIDYREILWVSLASIFNGFFISFVVNRKYFHRFSQKLGITKKFAEIDVWDYLFNSDDDEMKWITVRDIKNDLVFEGWVEAFSDTVKESELFLRDVIIYRNSTAEELYSVPGLYLSRNRDEMTIEFKALQYSIDISPH